LAKQPGNLNNLTGAGKQAWDTLMADAHQDAIAQSGTKHFLAKPTAAMTEPPATVDWDGAPIRKRMDGRNEIKRG
jgi:hypothetical protein